MITASLTLLLISAPASFGDQATCQIGENVLRDIAASRGPNDWQKFVAPDRDGLHPSLFDRCPRLLDVLPDGLRHAGKGTFERASDHGPSAPKAGATVYSVGVPSIDRDRRTATVTIRYVCSGLCAGEYVQRYRRTGLRWHRDGEPHTNWVS